jgi:hypothetical protein
MKKTCLYCNGLFGARWKPSVAGPRPARDTLVPLSVRTRNGRGVYSRQTRASARAEIPGSGRIEWHWDAILPWVCDTKVAMGSQLISADCRAAKTIGFHASQSAAVEISVRQNAARRLCVGLRSDSYDFAERLRVAPLSCRAPSCPVFARVTPSAGVYSPIEKEPHCR